MDKFNLKKYLAEGRLLKENTFTSNPNIKKLKKGESKDLNENIVNDAAEIATNISQVSGEEPFNALIFAGIIVGMSTVASVGAIADVSGYRFSDVKDFFYDLWVKYRIKPIVKRLSKDPEVIELVKSGKPGWQNMLRGKLSDKEEKYVYDIYRKHFK